MAFTVHTSADETSGLQFGDEDQFTVFASGVLKVQSKTYGVRIYAPGFWQLVEYRAHNEIRRRIE